MLKPYGAAKIVNAELDKHGIKRIPSQMMYNYTSQRVNEGKEPFIKYDAVNGVDEKDLRRWIDGYVAKKLGKKVDEKLARWTELAKL